MKAGAEAHFLSGQLFTLGIAAIAIAPRMPFDKSCSIGGKLSYPFRKALLCLVIIGVVRVVACHLHLTPSSSALLAIDSLLGTFHVVGQSFLCLTTAYLLQSQLAQRINIPGGVPGRSLRPFLAIVFVLTAVGFFGTVFYYPNLWCLVNLAEAISCYPVISTLRLYTSIMTVRDAETTAPHRKNAVLKGPILTQMLMVMELWYLASSIISFLAEAAGAQDYDSALMETEKGDTIFILLQALRHHQDNGVDDWTRLLMHSVFLNSVDELQHFSRPEEDQRDPSAANSNVQTGGENELVVTRRRQYASNQV